MPRFRLYSDRQKDAARQGTSDVYKYDEFSQKLRTQVRQIAERTFGESYKYLHSVWRNNAAAKWAHETLSHEKGRDHFGWDIKHPMPDLLQHLERGSIDDFLDTLEVVCVAIEQIVAPRSGSWMLDWDSTIPAKVALDDINYRLRDAGVGFQFEQGQLIRVDSQLVHAEIIKPALSLLNQAGFEGPEAEFLTAHEHYRSGRYKEAITEAAKSFESLMKAVCDRKEWPYQSGSRASDLLKVLRSHQLWPTYLDASFDQLVATLQSGLPKVRNDEAAHGQGAVKKAVPDYVAAYALHLAAAKMILIVRAADLAA